MTATFISLPCPAANGAGAATDLSSMGLTKTFTVTGVGRFTVNIEVNNESVSSNGSWAPVCSFVNGGEKVIQIAGRWFRARVTSYRSGTPVVGVGASDAGTTFVALPVPVGPGKGTAIDLSTLPQNKTVTVGGEFTGQIIVEISNNGSISFSQIIAFSKPGQYTFEATADWARIGRSGPSGGTPVVTVGGADDASGGGGAGAGTQYVFVWQPGATNHDNVYGDWTSLYAAVSAVEGAKIIEVYDPEANDAIIDVPGTYDLSDVTLMGRPVDGTLPSFYTEGAVLITKLRNIGPDLELDTNDQPPFVNESTEEGGSGATGPFRLNGISVVDDWWHYTEFTFALFLLSGGTTLSDNRVIQLDDDSSAELEFEVLDPTVRVGDNTIEVGTGCTLIVKAANWGTFSQDQIGGGNIYFNKTGNPSFTGEPAGLPTVPISFISGPPTIVSIGTLAIADTTSGPFACLLPVLSTSRTAQVIIKNTGASILTVTADAGAGDTIDGVATYALAAHSTVTLVGGQSTDWYVTAKG